VDDWEDGSLSSSITTGNIDNPLYSTLQNQAIHNVKSDDDDKPIKYTGEQLIEINTQNWEIHTTGSESVLTGFPCLSDWWDTSIHIHDSIHQPFESYSTVTLIEALVTQPTQAPRFN
jgi:hypothetical protein